MYLQHLFVIVRGISTKITIVLAIICIRINEIQIGGICMQAYCLKCREKREISDPQSVTLKNGRPATQGKCPNCGGSYPRAS